MHALIVIDMQMGFLNPASPLFIAGAPEAIPACAKVIEHCRAKGVPVIFVNRCYRADGSDVEHTRFGAWVAGGKPVSPGCAPEIGMDMPAEFGSADTDYHITKPRFSAFFRTELDLLLRRLGVDTVLLAGTTTPNCIRTTCYDAISLEYSVAVLTDCTSSASPEIQQANLADMERIGAQLLTSEAYLGGMFLDNSAARVRRQVQQGL